MNFNQLKAIANECVFSMEGITVMKTEEYDNRLKQITQLTNNWNELEEWVKELQKFKGINQQGFSWGVAQEVLDKMKEIKEKNK